MMISFTQARAGSVAMNRIVLPRSSACSMLARAWDGGGDLRHLGLVGDVHRERFALAGRLELLLGGGQGFLAAPRDDDMRAGARQLDRAGEADARAAAGDPGDFAAQASVWHIASRR